MREVAAPLPLALCLALPGGETAGPVEAPPGDAPPDDAPPAEAPPVEVPPGDEL